jgi:acetyl esterase/lipase
MILVLRNNSKYLSVLAIMMMNILPIVSGYTTNVPNTVSIEAQNYLKTLTHDPNTDPAPPSKSDVHGWGKYMAKYQKSGLQKSKDLNTMLSPIISKNTINGVPVIDVKPKGFVDNGKVIVYLHGGLIASNADSTLGNAILIANATGYRVVSVDYVNGLNARWQEATNQVVSVLRNLDNVTVYCGSAGCAVGFSALLKMRDQNFEMVDNIVAVSGWFDLTESGDTYSSLKTKDPLQSYEKDLKIPAQIYTGSTNMKHAYVSPVYGEFAGFPPTLIIGGTKDIFLSGFLRMYQAMEKADVAVKLDLYEGMTHSFVSSQYTLPESKLAFQKIKEFIEQ